MQLLLCVVLGVPAAVAFTPVDTDCIHWVQVGHGPPPPPSKTPPPMATPLIVGHQLMGDMSTDFQEICIKPDGSKLGHRNGNDEKVHVYGSCWIYDHEQIGKVGNFPLRRAAAQDLIWEKDGAGVVKVVVALRRLLGGLDLGRVDGGGG